MKRRGLSRGMCWERVRFSTMQSQYGRFQKGYTASTQPQINAQSMRDCVDSGIMSRRFVRVLDFRWNERWGIVVLSMILTFVSRGMYLSPVGARMYWKDDEVLDMMLIKMKSKGIDWTRKGVERGNVDENSKMICLWIVEWWVMWMWEWKSVTRPLQTTKRGILIYSNKPPKRFGSAERSMRESSNKTRTSYPHPASAERSIGELGEVSNKGELTFRNTFESAERSVGERIKREAIQ